MTDLEGTINDAWEQRDSLGSADAGSEVGQAVESAIDLLDPRRGARVAEPRGTGDLARQSVAEEGGAALLPSARQRADGRREATPDSSTRCPRNLPT